MILKSHWTNISLIIVALLTAGIFIYFIAGAIDAVTHRSDPAGDGLAKGYVYIFGIGSLVVLAVLHLLLHSWFYNQFSQWGQALFWWLAASPVIFWGALKIIFSRVFL